MGKLNETQRKEIIDMYTSQAFSAREIAEMFTVNQQTVYNTLARAGIKPNQHLTPANRIALAKKTGVKSVESADENVTVAEPKPEPETKTCKKCGKEIASEFLYCPYCGEKSKSEGELILEGLLAARAKVIPHIPENFKNNVDKQLLDASEYLRFLMKKAGHL